MDIKGIYDQVKLGGFQNPLGAPMASALEKLTPPSLAEFTALATTQAAANGLPVPSQGQLSAALAAMGSTVDNVNNMTLHSNILSGVDTSTGMTVTSIARLGNAAKMIEQVKGCEFPQAVMGALVNGAEIINDTAGLVADMDKYLANIPLWVSQIPGRVEEYGNKLADQVVSDTEALAMAKVAVINNSIASALVELTENECLSEIFASIMTTPLKNEVTKVTDVLKAKKLISIGG